MFKYYKFDLRLVAMYEHKVEFYKEIPVSLFLCTSKLFGMKIFAMKVFFIHRSCQRELHFDSKKWPVPEVHFLNVLSEKLCKG